MPIIKYRVTLSQSDRHKLEDLLSTGRLNRRTKMHAEVLLMADENSASHKMSEQAIANKLEINSQTVHTIRRRYAQHGLEAAISRKPRQPTANRTRITPEVRKQIIALSQTIPPAGKSRWTLRLLAHHVREQQIIDRISHETIGQVLKSASQQGII
ncbi:MAG: helix-turn-helix domain-containing protein [Eubacteriales bacterium]|nr:helix-turn-helix domain-containing protein [Eubacteriales bacterium]